SLVKYQVLPLSLESLKVRLSLFFSSAALIWASTKFFPFFQDNTDPWLIGSGRLGSAAELCQVSPPSFETEITRCFGFNCWFLELMYTSFSPICAAVDSFVPG